MMRGEGDGWPLVLAGGIGTWAGRLFMPENVGLRNVGWSERPLSWQLIPWVAVVGGACLCTHLSGPLFIFLTMPPCLLVLQAR